MLLAILAFGCADPAPVALTACQAVPGLSVDGTGLTLLTPVLTTRELEILKTAEPTRGLQTFGPEKLAELRSKTTCTVDEVKGAGSGHWAVDVTRTQPKLNLDGSLGEVEEVKMTYQAMKEDGMKVEVGLVQAAGMRANIADAVADEDWKRVASLTRSTAEAVHDPLMIVDIEEAYKLDTWHAYKHKVQVKLVGLNEGKLQGEVVNAGKQQVESAEIQVNFDVGGTATAVKATVGVVAAGQSVPFEVDMPEGAGDKVNAEVTTYEL